MSVHEKEFVRIVILHKSLSITSDIRDINNEKNNNGDEVFDDDGNDDDSDDNDNDTWSIVDPGNPSQISAHSFLSLVENLHLITSPSASDT